MRKVNGLFYSPFFCYTVRGSSNGGVGGIDGCAVGGGGAALAGGGGRRGLVAARVTAAEDRGNQ